MLYFTPTNLTWQVQDTTSHFATTKQQPDTFPTIQTLDHNHLMVVESRAYPKALTLERRYQPIWRAMEAILGREVATANIPRPLG